MAAPGDAVFSVSTIVVVRIVCGLCKLLVQQFESFVVRHSGEVSIYRLLDLCAQCSMKEVGLGKDEHSRVREVAVENCYRCDLCQRPTLRRLRGNFYR